MPILARMQRPTLGQGLTVSAIGHGCLERIEAELPPAAAERYDRAR